MLFLHEVHEVKGAKEDEFEEAYRDGWMPTLAEGDEARLLWYLHHAHGCGPAYHMVTITAIRDGAAWERLAHRLQRGDLAQWGRQLDELRHGNTAKMLLPVPWSPLQDSTWPRSPRTAPPTSSPSIWRTPVGPTPPSMTTSTSGRRGTTGP